MHYNNYEWTLYRSGILSGKMVKEMENHLEHCDLCLDAYLQTIPGLEESLPAAKPAQKASARKNNIQKSPIRWQRWAALVMTVVALFIGLSFTPQGQVVLAQIKSSLSEFGNSLSQMFGLPADSPYVQDIGQIQNTADGVSFELEQIVYENNQLRFSAVASGELPPETDLWLRWKLIADGKVQSVQGKAKGKTDSAGNASFDVISDPFETPSESGVLRGSLWLESISYVGEQGQDTKVSGPWTFKIYLAAGAAAKPDQMEVFDLNGGFEWNGMRYTYKELRLALTKQELLVDIEPIPNATPATINRHGEPESIARIRLASESGEGIDLKFRSIESTTESHQTQVFVANSYEPLKNAADFTITPYFGCVGMVRLQDEPETCRLSEPSGIQIQRTDARLAPAPTSATDIQTSLAGSELKNVSGTEIKLDQVIVEPRRITYSYILSGNFPGDHTFFTVKDSWFINGQLQKTESNRWDFDLIKEDGSVQALTTSFEFSDNIPTADHYDFTVIVNGIEVDSIFNDLNVPAQHDQIAGPWKFSFSVAADEFLKDKQQYALQKHTFQVEQYVYQLGELTLSPIDRSLTVTADHPLSEEAQQKLEAYPDSALGGWGGFDPEKTGPLTGFKLMTDQGESFDLTLDSANGSAGTNMTNILFQLNNYDYDKLKDAQSYQLIPWLGRESAEIDQEALGEGEPLESAAIAIRRDQALPLILPTAIPEPDSVLNDAHIKRVQLTWLHKTADKIRFSLQISGSFPEGIIVDHIDSAWFINGVPIFGATLEMDPIYLANGTPNKLHLTGSFPYHVNEDGVTSDQIKTIINGITLRNQNSTTRAFVGPWVFEADGPAGDRFEADDIRQLPAARPTPQPVQDQPVTKKEPGINIALDQVLVERERLTYTLLIDGELPEGTGYITHMDDLEINGEKISTRYIQGSYSGYGKQPAFLLRTDWELPEQFREITEFHIKLTVHDLEIKPDLVSKNKDTLKLKGPWVFEFDIDNTELADNTRVFPIGKEFELESFEQPVTYKIDELVISPIRQYLRVTKLDAGLPRSEPLVLEPLSLFELTAADGFKALLTRKEIGSDPEGNTIYTYLVEENSYDRLKDQLSFTLMPYRDPTPTGMIRQSLDGQEALETTRVQIPVDPTGTETTKHAPEVTPVQSGIDIKLDQVILEKDTLWFSLLFSGALPKDTSRVEAFPDLFLNGEPFSMNGVSGSNEVVDADLPVIMTIWKWGFKKQLPSSETLHFQIKINRLRIVSRSKPEKTLEGSWTFDFEVTPGALENDTQTILLDKTFKVGKAVYTVESMTFSPLHQRIKAVRYRAQQDAALANRLQNIPVGNLRGFMVITNTGEEIPFESDYGGNSNEIGRYLTFETSGDHFEALKSAETLTIVPYVADMKHQSSESGLKAYFPLDEEAIVIGQAINKTDR